MDIKKELTKYIPTKLIDDLAEYLSLSHLMHIGVNNGCIELQFNFGHNPHICEDFWKANWKLIGESNNVNISYSINLDRPSAPMSIFERQYTQYIAPPSTRYFDQVEFKIKGIMINMKQEGKVISLDDEEIKIIPSKAKQNSFSLDPDKLEKEFRIGTIGKINLSDYSATTREGVWSAIQKAEKDIASAMMCGMFEPERYQRGQAMYENSPPKRIAVFTDSKRIFDDFMRGHEVIARPRPHDQHYWIRSEDDLRGAIGFDDFIVLDVPRPIEHMLSRSGYTLGEFMERHIIGRGGDRNSPRSIPKRFF